jgi:FkbM family methyltransferase
MLLELVRTEEYAARIADRVPLLEDGPDERFLDLAYRRVLRRGPDHGGLAHYGAMLRAGTPRREVAVDLVMADEHTSSIVDSGWLLVDMPEVPRRASFRQATKGALPRSTVTALHDELRSALLASDPIRQVEALVRDQADGERLRELEVEVANLRQRQSLLLGQVGLSERPLRETGNDPDPTTEALKRRVTDALQGDRGMAGTGTVPPGLIEVGTAVGSMLLPTYDRHITPSLVASGSWEPDQAEFVRTRLEPGQTVIDIGAHVGFYTLLAAAAVGGTGRVLAVEVSPTNFPVLCANIARNNWHNVLPLNFAASDHTGTVELTLSEENSGGSRAYRLDYVEPNLTVPCVALDELLEPEVPIHLVKVDIEGMDHVALAGLRQTLERWKPIVVTEFFPEWIEYLGSDPKGVLADYEALGYSLAILNHGDVVDCCAADVHDAALTSDTRYIQLVLYNASPTRSAP